jgi:hypothetical protein
MKWKNALYDTYSLVTLDALLQRDPNVGGKLPGMLAVEESFSSRRMRSETANRLRTRTEVLQLPAPTVVATILRGARLPVTVAEIDALVYVAAIHYKVPVVTGDERFEDVLRIARVAVNQLAVLLQESGRRKTRA